MKSLHFSLLHLLERYSFSRKGDGSVEKHAVQMARSTSEDSRLRTLFKTLSKQKMLMLMSLPFLVWVIIFKYLPLWGWTIAFQKFRLARDLFDQTWIGLDNFRSLFKEQQFYLVLRNTLVMSSINLVLGFVTAIVLALLLMNCVRSTLSGRCRRSATCRILFHG